MKKALSVLTAAAMLLSFFLILPQGKAAADVTEKETAIKELIDENVVISDGATLDYNGTSLKNGMAVIKVTLPKDEMVQFQQPITDFFDGTSHLNIGIGANAANDFNDARIRIRIAESTDITEPEKAAWNFFESATLLWMGPGTSTPCIYSNKGAYRPQPLKPIFGRTDDTQGVYMGTPISGSDATWSQTLMKQTYLPDEEGVYIRVASAATVTSVFTITIISDDIVAPGYTDGDLYFESPCSYVEETFVDPITGVMTAKVRIAAQSYAQYLEPQTDLVKDEAPKADIAIQLGANTEADYSATNFYLQLTEDDDPTEGILHDNLSVLSWNFVVGAEGILYMGVKDTNNVQYSGSYKNTPGQNGIKPDFINGDNGKVKIVSSYTQSTMTSNGVLTGDDGVYVRLLTVTAGSYTLILTPSSPPLLPATDSLDWTFYDHPGGAESTSTDATAAEADSTSESFRKWDLEIPAKTVAQFNTKITDLDEAMILYNLKSYEPGTYVGIQFVLDKTEPISVTQGYPLTFWIVRPEGDPGNFHILFGANHQYPEAPNANPTLGSATVASMQSAGGLLLTVDKAEDGHYYLGVGGKTLIGLPAYQEYMRLDEYIENGAYIRAYNQWDSAKSLSISFSSADVPVVNNPGGKVEEELTPEEKFLAKFTENIDAIRDGNEAVIAELAALWNELSFIEQSTIEGYFLDNDEYYELLRIIKAYSAELIPGGEEEEEEYEEDPIPSPDTSDILRIIGWFGLMSLCVLVIIKANSKKLRKQ